MGISRRNLFGKLTPTLFRAIESATALAKLRGNPHVELVHWLLQLSQAPDSDFVRILTQAGLESARLHPQLTAALGQLPAGASSLSDFSAHVEHAIERAWLLASLSHREGRVRSAWLLEALLTTPALCQQTLAIAPLLQALTTPQALASLGEWAAHSAEANEPAHDGSGLAQALPGEASAALAAPSEAEDSLTRFCDDLTARARAGGIDPVIGRDGEIRAMIDILLRRRQNNPLLTGEAGVGKTAVVEGLALALIAGDAPPALRQARVLALDIGALLAGASMRGEFESRLKGVLAALDRDPHPTILFIDEVHTLVGAGGQAGVGDAANLLKPALARGRLRAIGATTWGEYKCHIEKDPALTRRFQLLQVHEPDEARAIDMLRGLTPTLGRHHQVAILDDAVRAAVTLSQRYIPSRQLPDKAISLLDTACARAAMSLHAPPDEVARLRENQLALALERQVLESEAALGRPRETALAALAAREAETHARLEHAEARWQTELQLVQRILEAQQTLQAALQADETGAEQIANIQQLEAELHAVQGDTPLIHGVVDGDIVAQIVAGWTGIPVGRVRQDSISAALGLQATLTRRVVGQDEALAAIARRVQTARAGLTDPNKPVGIFLLAGPSGVGKTETALALAEALYGGEHNLITLNMSEYQEAHTVSTLKGSPPGYVGYGEGGVLTEAVRRRPHSVVLLDEIEKAHPDVHEVFFQVFDKGWMEDSEGRAIDFRHTLILLTSNVGAERLAEWCEDPAVQPTFADLQTLLQPELRQVFPAAFLGRLVCVPYLPLPNAQLRDIVMLQLDKVARRLHEQHGVTLHTDPALADDIVARCDCQHSGARLLASHIEARILPQLAGLWLDASQQRQRIAAIAMAPAHASHTLCVDGVGYQMTLADPA